MKRLTRRETLGLLSAGAAFGAAPAFGLSGPPFLAEAIMAGDMPEVVITRAALESFFNIRVAAEDAANLVIEEAVLLARAARATPADDGTITLTARILSSRDWSSDAYVE